MYSETLVDILVHRDEMRVSDAVEMVEEARHRVSKGENPENILFDDFGLEPDYMFELM